MSSFEKHIKNNKKQLESNEADPKIWLSIENEILKSKHGRNILYLKLVSLAAMILLGILFFGSQLSSNNVPTEIDLLQKYGLEEHQFTVQVANKRSALSIVKIPSDREADFQILIQQLEYLDKQYHEYLKKLEEHSYQMSMVDKLLNYYRSKIELLDKIQQEVEKVNYYENKFPSNEEKVGLRI